MGAAPRAVAAFGVLAGMPTENLRPTWQEHLLRDVDAVEDSFHAHPRAGDPSVLTDPCTEAGSSVGVMPTENVYPTWHEHLLYKDVLDGDPSPDALTARIRIEQHMVRAQEAPRVREEREAREEDREDEDARARMVDDGSPVREPPR